MPRLINNKEFFWRAYSIGSESCFLLLNYLEIDIVNLTKELEILRKASRHTFGTFRTLFALFTDSIRVPIISITFPITGPISNRIFIFVGVFYLHSRQILIFVINEGHNHVHASTIKSRIAHDKVLNFCIIMNYLKIHVAYFIPTVFPHPIGEWINSIVLRFFENLVILLFSS